MVSSDGNTQQSYDDTDEDENYCSSSSSSSLDHPVQKGAAIKQASHVLEKYFHWAHVFLEDSDTSPSLQEPEMGNPSPILADSRFVTSLDSFTTSLDSRILYGLGQYRDEGSNGLRRAAMRYASLARRSGIPVVSYFCRLQSADPPPHRSRETMEAGALVSALIRQLAELLPAEFSSSSPSAIDTTPGGSKRLRPRRLAALDGTLRTWEAALDLLVDLVRAAGLPHLIFVIDGLNLLDDDNAGDGENGGSALAARLGELVRCLLYHLQYPPRRTWNTFFRAALLY